MGSFQLSDRSTRVHNYFLSVIDSTVMATTNTDEASVFQELPVIVVSEPSVDPPTAPSLNPEDILEEARRLFFENASPSSPSSKEETMDTDDKDSGEKSPVEATQDLETVSADQDPEAVIAELQKQLARAQAEAKYDRAHRKQGDDLLRRMREERDDLLAHMHETVATAVAKALEAESEKQAAAASPIRDPRLYRPGDLLARTPASSQHGFDVANPGEGDSDERRLDYAQGAEAFHSKRVDHHLQEGLSYAKACDAADVELRGHQSALILDSWRDHLDHRGCKKCGEVGHTRKDCPKERTCTFCDFSHDVSVCPDLHSLCWRCLKRGHRAERDSEKDCLKDSRDSLWQELKHLGVQTKDAEVTLAPDFEAIARRARVRYGNKEAQLRPYMPRMVRYAFEATSTPGCPSAWNWFQDQAKLQRDLQAKAEKRKHGSSESALRKRQDKPASSSSRGRGFSRGGARGHGNSRGTSRGSGRSSRPRPDLHDHEPPAKRGRFDTDLVGTITASVIKTLEAHHPQLAPRTVAYNPAKYYERGGKHKSYKGYKGSH